MTHYVPFESINSQYRYSTMNNDSQRIMKLNSHNFSNSNQMNKMMKSDLLSSHFDLGRNEKTVASESQSNYYKKQMFHCEMTATRSRLKQKIEKQNFSITMKS